MPGEETKDAAVAPQAAKEGAKEKSAKAKGGKDKAVGKSAAKGKAAGKQKGSGKKGADDATLLPSIANHPRAGAHVGRTKAWGGLAGFGLVAVLSWRAHVPVSDLLLRSLAGGVAAYVVAWAGAVAIWRHLVVAELRAVRVQRAAVLAKLASTQQAEGAGARAPGA